MTLHAALITLLNMTLIGVAMYYVGRARGIHQVHAPTVVGHPDFERAFRAHQNTLEQTVMFLPTLWVATVFGNPTYAAWLGYAWLIGRTWYLFGYLRAADKRGAGFMVSAIAWMGLFVVALIGLVPKLLA
ncbi:MAG: MAPEG family protein [Gammaproteobacteria bacterium]|nr:MAPEG family protein [Gammaproteobacteria bacterium]